MKSKTKTLALLGALGATLGVSACSRGCGEATSEAPEAAASAPRRGDRVVVEPRAAQFFEGRVLELSGEQLRVQVEGEDSAQTVAVGDVYLLPPPAHAFRAGELAICKMEDGRWQGCRIDRAQAKITAGDASGRTHELAPNDVLDATEVTELNLRAHFARSRAKREFSQALERAGAPLAPKDFRPQPRGRVLARRDRNWYSARIHEIEDEALHVTWLSDQRTTELPYRDVVPEPPYPDPPRVGQFALKRPENLTQAWIFVRVESLRGQEAIVVDVEGNETRLPRGELVPLGR